MTMYDNPFKTRLKNGEPLLGLWMSMVSPIAAEALSEAGYDWQLFDTEHAPVDVAGVLPLLQAAQGGKTASIVRPAWNDKVLIKRLLDIGAQTLLIPFIQNASEAEAAVSAMRYPPHGIRGVAGATRASRYGRTKDYLSNANSNVCCLVQIETGAALAELDKIAQVDGVDGIFIGPSDLAASLGHLGNPSHPDVQNALKKAIDQLKQLNVPAGILATNTEDAKRYQEWGYQFIAVGVDISLLVQSANTRLAEVAG